MLDTLRRVMYIGLGAAAMSVDRIRESIDELVARGDISAEEGKKLYSDLTARAEEQGRAMNERMKTQVRQMLTDMGVADKSQIEMLQSRIETLERRVTHLEAENLKPQETTEA